MNPVNIYLSLFMFTVDLRPGDPDYTKILVQHLKELRQQGYTGFDLPIHPTATLDHQPEIDRYAELRRALDRAGLDDIGFTTNVAATRTFDPTSLYGEQREIAFGYLKSRVDITAVLGGRIMAGPIVFPYNIYQRTISATRSGATPSTSGCDRATSTPSRFSTAWASTPPSAA